MRLRDVTGTVSCVPLIATSIMSKKIAEGTGSLVLDVKVGSGAFMKELGQARELAQTMVRLGTDAGVKTVALLTNMQTPLGLTAGNALEVRESVEVLEGGGPPDVVELTLALAREMVAAAGRDDVDPADALADGRAMDVWRRMIRAQGGDPDAPLPVARETHVVEAPADGVLVQLDALAVGVAAWRLGAGRARKEDPVQAGAGVEIHAKPGAVVRGGEPLLTLHTDEPERFDRAHGRARGWLPDRPGGVEAGPAADRHRTRLLRASAQVSGRCRGAAEGRAEARLGVCRGPRVMFSSSARQGGTDATAAVRDHRAKLAGPGADPQDRWTVGSPGRLVEGPASGGSDPVRLLGAGASLTPSGPAGNFVGLAPEHRSRSGVTVRVRFLRTQQRVR